MPKTIRLEDLVKFRKFIELKLEDAAASNVGEDSTEEDAVLLNAKDLVIDLNKEFHIGELLMLYIYEPEQMNSKNDDKASENTGSRRGSKRNSKQLKS